MFCVSLCIQQWSTYFCVSLCIQQWSVYFMCVFVYSTMEYLFSVCFVYSTMEYLFSVFCVFNNGVLIFCVFCIQQFSQRTGLLCFLPVVYFPMCQFYFTKAKFCFIIVITFLSNIAILLYTHLLLFCDNQVHACW